MFRINTGIISVSCDSLKRTGRQLSELTSELNDSIRAVGGMKGMDEVIGVLRSCQEEMENEYSGITNCDSSLERIDESYMRSETQIINNADGANIKFKLYSTGIVQMPRMSGGASTLINNLII